jgi:N-acetylneuraminate lyase
MNTPTDSLRGTFPAFLTPLTSEGEIADAVATRYLSMLCAAGVDGVYLGGSTGEGMLLGARRRMHLLETLMAVLPQGKKMLVHVGTGEIESTLALSAHAARTGAHAISSLPPKGDSCTVYSFYERLAKESALPLILYYFPQLSPDAFPSDVDLFEVCELPNVLGVKFTDYNLFLLQQLVERGLTVYNGRDEIYGAGLLMGASGGIGSTFGVLPQEAVAIASAARSQDWEAVQQSQKRLNTVLQTWLRYPYLAALKLSCNRWFGLEMGPVLSETFAEPAQIRELSDRLDDLNRSWQFSQAPVDLLPDQSP